MGKLFYVVGASGVGKNSLLGFARAQVPRSTPILFAHRYITRSAHAGNENHIELSDQEFSMRKKNGCFSMDWQSHNTQYGIGVEIDHWLNTGLSVVINGSRAYLSQAATKYQHNLTPILVSANVSLLRQRLIDRGRETISEIDRRLTQAQALNEQTQQYSNLLCIENNDQLENAGSRLVDLLVRESSIGM